jgi:hypothetical protein
VAPRRATVDGGTTWGLSPAPDVTQNALCTLLASDRLPSPSLLHLPQALPLHRPQLRPTARTRSDPPPSLSKAGNVDRLMSVISSSPSVTCWGHSPLLGGTSAVDPMAAEDVMPARHTDAMPAKPAGATFCRGFCFKRRLLRRMVRSSDHRENRRRIRHM